MSAPAQIRLVRPAEIPTVGELTASVYVGDGLLPPDSSYVNNLRDAARRAEHADLLVAVHDHRVVGTVAFVLPGSPYAHFTGDREAEFRMLAVDPTARGRGVGTALVNSCVDRARAVGCTILRLSTQPNMTTAHRLYQGMGFARTPDHDWEPEPGVTLLTYALDLGPVYCDRCGEPASEGGHEQCRRSRALEPPRWCTHCRRRMVVQILPTGWTARCSRHGVVTG